MSAMSSCFVRRGARTTAFALATIPSSLSHLGQQCPCGHEIGGLAALVEPVVDGFEAARAPGSRSRLQQQPRQRGGRAQLERAGLLLPRRRRAPGAGWLRRRPSPRAAAARRAPGAARRGSRARSCARRRRTLPRRPPALRRRARPAAARRRAATGTSSWRQARAERVQRVEAGAQLRDGPRRCALRLMSAQAWNRAAHSASCGNSYSRQSAMISSPMRYRLPPRLAAIGENPLRDDQREDACTGWRCDRPSASRLPGSAPARDRDTRAPTAAATTSRARPCRVRCRTARCRSRAAPGSWSSRARSSSRLDSANSPMNSRPRPPVVAGDRSAGCAVCSAWRISRRRLLAALAQIAADQVEERDGSRAQGRARRRIAELVAELRARGQTSTRAPAPPSPWSSAGAAPFAICRASSCCVRAGPGGMRVDPGEAALRERERFAEPEQAHRVLRGERRSSARWRRNPAPSRTARRAPPRARSCRRRGAPPVTAATLPANDARRVGCSDA